MTTAEEAGFAVDPFNADLRLEEGYRWLVNGDVIQIGDEVHIGGAWNWYGIHSTGLGETMEVGTRSPHRRFLIMEKLEVAVESTVICTNCDRSADAATTCWWCGARN